MSDIKEIVDKHDKDIKDLKSAFDTDAKGEPDFYGHRKDHGEKKEEVQQKKEILTNVSSWAVIGLLTLMLSHFIQGIKDFLSTIGK